MIPSIGRIVHYAGNPGEPWVPAIITKVHSESCVNVRIFPDNDGDVLFAASVMRDDYNGNFQGPRWRWPPRTE
jgi:hypothetical protein